MNQFDYVSNAANGRDAQDLLQNQLLHLRQKGDLSIVVKTYRAGDPKAKNAGQFYAPFMIQFHNGSRWIIFSTTSCRTDRIKGQQWDADNLKRLDPTIEKAILTYPDNVSSTEKNSFQKQKGKYDKGLEISKLDDVIPNEELISQIENNALDIFREQQENEQQEVSSSPSVEGREYDFNGKAFEQDVAMTLTNDSYLTMMKNNITECGDRKYNCFVKMLKTFKVSPCQITRISATARKEDIGLLPSGGQPKTDVWATFFFENGTSLDFTISCKRTTKSSVSVHQYTADAFADVLSPNNNSLRSLLKVFQLYANARDMPEADRLSLTTELQPLLPKLCKWVLGGFGGEYANEIQCANYLVVYNPTDEYFGIHTVDDYTQMLLKRPPLAFGTPFGWTYASKQRQRSIQLKLPILR